VIALTEELLAIAKQNDISGSDMGTIDRVSPSLLQSKGNKMVNPPLLIYFCVWLLGGKCASSRRHKLYVRMGKFLNATYGFGFYLKYRSCVF
jgi:hypothetical protein